MNPSPNPAPLVLEYVFEGPQRGYNFTSPTHGYAEDTLKAIWRSAMPRGQGWTQYVGAESRKCFALPNGKWVSSHVTVTDLADEGGRRGIRRAVIEVVPLHAYGAYLRQCLEALPAGVRDDADQQIAYWQRTRTLDRLAGKIKKAEHLILTHPYSTLADWRFVEAVVLKLAITPIGPLKAWGQRLGFTTLALAHHEEAPLVAMPAEKVATIRDVPVVKLTF